MYGHSYQTLCENLRLILSKPQSVEGVKLSFEIFCNSVKSTEKISKNYSTENDIYRRFEMVFLSFLKGVMPFTSQIKLVGLISDFHREKIILGLDRDQRTRYKIADESKMSEKGYFDETLSILFQMIQMESGKKNSFTEHGKSQERKISINP